jgi:hypothetical protein
MKMRAPAASTAGVPVFYACPSTPLSSSAAIDSSRPDHHRMTVMEQAIEDRGGEDLVA